MRYFGSIVVVAALSSITAVQGQTVRSHSSLRIPTPAIDEASEADANVPIRPRASDERTIRMQAASSSETRFVPAREASLLREIEPANRPALEPLGDQPASASVRSVSTNLALMPVSSSAIGSGVQYFGPSIGSASTVDATVVPAGYVQQANYGAVVAPSATVSPMAVAPSTYPPNVIGASGSYSAPTVVQTSFSAPATGACCNGANVGPVVTSMPSTYAGTTFPTTSYPASTVFAPPVADAASYPPSLVGSTIPGAAPSGQAVPFLINPVAVNVPAVPVDESRLTPVLALRPTVPEESYAGRGILGQPELYVRGQHVRNVLRYITLW